MRSDPNDEYSHDEDEAWGELSALYEDATMHVVQLETEIERLCVERDAAIARAEKAEATLSRLEEWTHVFGRALCQPRADTYGEGIHDAKEQVARILRKEGWR